MIVFLFSGYFQWVCILFYNYIKINQEKTFPLSLTSSFHSFFLIPNVKVSVALPFQKPPHLLQVMLFPVFKSPVPSTLTLHLWFLACQTPVRHFNSLPPLKLRTPPWISSLSSILLNEKQRYKEASFLPSLSLPQLLWILQNQVPVTSPSDGTPASSQPCYPRLPNTSVTTLPW